MGLMVGTVMHWQGVELRGLLHLGRVGWLLVCSWGGVTGDQRLFRRSRRPNQQAEKPLWAEPSSEGS